MVADTPEADWEGKGVEMTYDQLGTFFLFDASQDLAPEQLLAMVTNVNLKKGRGKCKGGKGARPPRKCYECDTEDHNADNCPFRAARIAS